MKKRRKKKSLIASFFKIVISMVLIFLVFAGAGIFAYSKLSGNSASDGESKKATETNLLDALKGQHITTNVAVFGVDADEVRSDVIFVVHYDSKTEKISLLSVPRDTHVKMTDELIALRRENGSFIPVDGAGNSGYCKINEVYSYAGEGHRQEMAVLQLEDLLGIEIDNYVVINFEAFVEIVDMVGGVDVYVPQDMYKDMSDTGDIVINLKEGYQHLDGAQAQQLVRFRGYPGGDVARVQVQQEFLKALAEKVLSTETIMKNATTLIKTAYEYVTTDFTLTDMLKYANYLDNIDPEGITMQTIPGVGEYIGDTSYYIYDEDLIGETVDMFLRGTTAEIEAQKAEAEKQAVIESGEAISSVGKNIMVANGGYKSGFAGQNQTMLEEEGFTVQGVYTYNGEKTSYTRIVVPEEGMGYDLQEYYPSSQIIVDETMMENGEDILIILGTDEWH